VSREQLAGARTRTLDEAVRYAHVLVTTGAGGVGKTTTAAALGLAAARAGRRTLVLTIDPARRLAQAMGLDHLGDEPARVPLDALDVRGLAEEGDPADPAGPAADPADPGGPAADPADPAGPAADPADPGGPAAELSGAAADASGPAAGDGELWAMMLDMQTTFDRLIDRNATSPENARAIKSNRIYRTLSSTLSGTQEYMAMERLHELHESGEWDLLVVDTPPTRSALDFLDAPKRMTTFLDGRLLKLLLKPGLVAGRGIGRVVGAGATAFMRVAGKVTGMDLLEDLAEFFREFEGMYEGFKQRAEQVLELLRDPDSRFVVVTSPEPPPLREAKFFLERLEQEGLHAAGVVVNRVRPEVPRDPSDAALRRAIDALGGAEPDHLDEPTADPDPAPTADPDPAPTADPDVDADLDEPTADPALAAEPAPTADPAADPDGEVRPEEAAAVAGTLRLLGDVRNLAARQRRDVAAALYGVKVRTLVEVPLLGGDVHDLRGLQRIATTLTTGKSR
jgi:anion-transporting  ArsA/GET3 family ATPase